MVMTVREQRKTKKPAWMNAYESIRPRRLTLQRAPRRWLAELLFI
jgi:hypothetical protein